MIAEKDLKVGTIVIDPWYYAGESGEIISIKGRMLMPIVTGKQIGRAHV